MKKSHITEENVCHASIKTEIEIKAIQKNLIETKDLDLMIKWIEGIKDPTRFKLVYLLLNQKQLCVCDLANILEVSSSAISQHLRKLKDMDLVCCQRQNQTLFYKLKSEEFLSFIKRLVPSLLKDAG